MPTQAELLVFRGVRADATLETLAPELAQAAPEWRGWGATNWGAMGRGEAEELEGLLETLLNDAGFFARRREDVRSRMQLEMLACRAQDGTLRRQVLPEGWVPVPGDELLADVHRGRLKPIDLSILSVVVLTLATRRVAPAYESQRERMEAAYGAMLTT